MFMLLPLGIFPETTAAPPALGPGCSWGNISHPIVDVEEAAEVIKLF